MATTRKHWRSPSPTDKARDGHIEAAMTIASSRAFGGRIVATVGWSTATALPLSQATTPMTQVERTKKYACRTNHSRTGDHPVSGGESGKSFQLQINCTNKRSLAILQQFSNLCCSWQPFFLVFFRPRCPEAFDRSLHEVDSAHEARHLCMRGSFSL